MSIEVKCARCGGNYSLSTKTRRRAIYTCEKCGRELPVRKRPKDKDTKD